MSKVLLIDFGSTNTKVTAVDIEHLEVLGTAAAPTTVQTDIGDGLNIALEALYERSGDLDFSARYACSSAAGGLAMFASGLVPSLTTTAASLAALGAGAKLKKVFSYELTSDDIDEIDSTGCDIFLLTGGTDGGNKECVLHNAEQLSKTTRDFPIIIACNRSAASASAKILSGKQTFVCQNVMPTLETLNVEPVREKIRELFLVRIVAAKGLSREERLVDGILMPTPAAFLQAMELLARGTKSTPGLGELFAVDLGGATTDCYSCADGKPTRENTMMKGLVHPWAKRSVEGDIGVRISACGILQAAGVERVAALADTTPDETSKYCQACEQDPAKMPANPQEVALDMALAKMAVETASKRHAGTVEEIYTPMGASWVQTGKDLGRVKTLVASGGALVNIPQAAEVAAHALASADAPTSLRPTIAKILIDRKYIVSAMGLLSEANPDAALNILKSHLCEN